MVLDSQLETVCWPAIAKARCRLLMSGASPFVPIGTGYPDIGRYPSRLFFGGITKDYRTLFTSYSAKKYFNTIEKVTIAYEVSIGNTTAILCC